jgi:hypothetical protein
MENGSVSLGAAIALPLYSTNDIGEARHGTRSHLLSHQGLFFEEGGFSVTLVNNIDSGNVQLNNPAGPGREEPE